jgi:hypothetical protein
LSGISDFSYACRGFLMPICDVWENLCTLWPFPRRNNGPRSWSGAHEIMREVSGGHSWFEWEIGAVYWSVFTICWIIECFCKKEGGGEGHCPVNRRDFCRVCWGEVGEVYDVFFCDFLEANGVFMSTWVIWGGFLTEWGKLLNLGRGRGCRKGGFGKLG